MVFKSILYWYQNIRIYAVFCPLRISVFYLSNTEILFSLIKCALSYRNMTLLSVFYLTVLLKCALSYRIVEPFYAYFILQECGILRWFCAGRAGCADCDWWGCAGCGARADHHDSCWLALYNSVSILFMISNVCILS